MMIDPQAVLFDRILDVADYLEARNVDIGAAIKRRDPVEPGRREKEAAEERMRRAALAYLSGQKKRVREVLEREIKATIPPSAFDNAWDDPAGRARLIAELRRAVLEGVVLFSDLSAIGFDENMVNTAVIDWVREYGAAMVNGLDATSKNALDKALIEFAQTPGYTVGDVMKSLLPTFSPRRAELIAITEITRAFAEANQRAGEQLKREFPGVRVIKQWWTNNDPPTVCPICFPLHAQIVDIDKPFVHPETGGEYFNPPSPHSRCRCWTTTTTDISGTAGTP